MKGEFTSETLYEVLCGMPHARAWRIAFSGGLDSTVLLHACAQLRNRLDVTVSAIHVDHGIHAQSAEWAAHCVRVCTALGVPLESLHIDARPVRGQSPEAHARELRYEAMTGRLAPDELLLTAHHLDDQFETLLLQLMRGAGPAGLAGMPQSRVLGSGRHARPLLGFTREALQSYADRHGLEWIEDESNTDTGLDRNFLRHEIVPRLKSRWPAAARSAARAAGHAAEAEVLLRELARLDMGSCYAAETRTLRVSLLRGLSSARQANVIRNWLRDLGLPAPDSGHLQQIRDEVMDARADAEPCVGWDGAQVRRFRDHLVAMPAFPAPDPALRLAWRMDQPCELSYGRLSAERGRGAGIRAADVPDDTLEVRYRTGGERINLPGRAHRRILKELFRDSGIPGWWRDVIPLLFVDGKLAAVAGLWVDADYSAGPEEDGWRITWSGMREIPVIRT